MKQVLQDLRSGATEVVDVPRPAVRRGQLLIATGCSLVSIGTERMLVDFGKAGWLDKARQQPDKVRMVLDKIKTDGLLPTIQAVRNKLDQPMAMGYSNAGTVVELGEGVSGYKVGDRVVSNGRHAEYVAVPANLCAAIPASVSDEEASFTVLGAIALQGIRLVQPTLGEAVVVTGLGLIGLLTVQLLRAHGCRVLGIDLDPSKLRLAQQFGAEVVDVSAGEDPMVAAQRFTRGRGVDAVIITASTKSSEPVRQAALMSRKRGRIVLVGVTGLELSRADFYEKELSFQVSCSYGPGRYDPEYEEKGHDYPFGFVRWTEQRNFEAFLDMLAEHRVDVRSLISHRYPIERAAEAYEHVSGAGSALGIVLTYPQPSPNEDRSDRIVEVSTATRAPSRGVVGFIGAGNYASSTLIPAFAKAGASLHTVTSAAGVSSVSAARKFGFARASSDSASVLGEPDIDSIIIASRHDTHARYVLEAHAAGKNVFVEKPLCLTLEELAQVQAAYSDADLRLMVGFNRRFSPQVAQVRKMLTTVQAPKAFVMTVNAGAIPANHWTQDPEVGGGRIVGEACHFIDLLRYLADAKIVHHSLSAMAGEPHDTVTISLQFEDGSIGAIHYFANGSKRFPKERLEVFTSGRILRLDNFRRLYGDGWPGFKRMNLWQQDKGQQACAAAFIRAVKEGLPSPIPLAEIFEVTRVSIELQAMAQ